MRQQMIVALLCAGLSACAGSTPLVERARLPKPPDNFGKPVALPQPERGQSAKVFALENRAAAHLANKRLENDREFGEALYRAYGQEGEDQWSSQNSSEPAPSFCLFC